MSFLIKSFPVEWGLRGGVKNLRLAKDGFQLRAPTLKGRGGTWSAFLEKKIIILSRANTHRVAITKIEGRIRGKMEEELGKAKVLSG